jgi:hypothetical protein
MQENTFANRFETVLFDICKGIRGSPAKKMGPALLMQSPLTQTL